jgi:Uma2 family endonuclease
MSTVQDKLTAADLLMMPDGDDYELVNGQLVERNMSQESSWVAGEVFRRLANVGEDSGLGWAFPEGTSYQCFQHLEDDPERTRRPDASFIRKERLPGGPVRKGHSPIAPDLAVEVVSPNDAAYEIEEKVQEWLAVGVQQVWVVMPPARTVTVHRAEGRERILHESDELTAEGLISGFRCRVGDLFPQLDPAK